MKWVLVAIVIIAISGGILLTRFGSLNEPLTELYFVEHEQLPSILAATQVEPVELAAALRGNITPVYGVAIAQTPSSPALPKNYSATYPFTASLVFDQRNWTVHYARGQAPTTWSEPAYFQTVSEPVLFGIRNAEGEPKEYTYRVEAFFAENEIEPLDPEQPADVLIAEGNVELGPIEFVEIPLNVELQQVFKRARIQISLVDREERIHFWVARQ